MNGGFLEIAIWVATAALLFAGTCTMIRLLRGPSLLDRAVALDVLAAVVVGMIGVTAIQTDESALIDVALALALVAFLATVAFARFLEEHNPNE